MPTVVTAKVDGKIVKTVLDADYPKCPFSHLPWKYRRYGCKGRIVPQTKSYDLWPTTLQIVCTANSHHTWIGKMEKIKEWRPNEYFIQKHVEQVNRLNGTAKPPNTVYPLKL